MKTTAIKGKTLWCVALIGALWATAAAGEPQSRALVFLIGGQSNAGGVAAIYASDSPQYNGTYGSPTTPDSTAEEVGIPLTGAGYPRSDIWNGSWSNLVPGGGYYTSPYPADPNRHGIELPMAMRLEAAFPLHDKFFIKHGPGGHNLHTQWKAGTGPDYVTFMKRYNAAMSDLTSRYDTVEVIGLYWDQGESDVSQAAAYEQNLTDLFASLRTDTGIPDLPIYVRKMMFDDQYIPIANAQTAVTAADPHAHLLDLDLKSNEANFNAWAWLYGNGHLSSKAFLELSDRILAIPNPFTSCVNAQAAENTAIRTHAQDLLSKAGSKDVELRMVKNLGHDEAFRVTGKEGKLVVEHQAPAGALYGAQAVIRDEYESGTLETPDFDIRGTTLCLMPGGYRATLSPKLYPWFYDKAFMTRTLDDFADARLNTIFLWAGHMFPYIVEMPDYPEAASDVPPEQIKANQEQFRWFTNECEKRNIRVLLHFYNIHVSPPFAKKHKIKGGRGGTAPTTPTPLLREYTYYALSRYFEEFASVGLYACPGESIHSQYQLEWFRDVIFKAARDSGKNPLIVIRDWTLNHDFRNQLKSLYENVYSELKHNDESLSSPYPDVRHLQLEGMAKGHIVNFHLVTDLVPMRWGSPGMLQEGMQHLKSLGFVDGVEFFGQMFWKWPYTLDKLTPSQKGYWPDGPKLVSLDRDAIYFKAFGRYLWNAERDAAVEESYWANYLGKKFGSEQVGTLLQQWYVKSGSISPGLQNLNQTRVSGWWPTVMLRQMYVDQILDYNKSLDETPYTLYRETGRAKQRYYPRPFDAVFFERYRKTYGLPKPGKLPAMYKEFAPYKARLAVADLEQRHVMPVSQYAALLEQGEGGDQALAPDKTVKLLHTLAKESRALARQAVVAAKEDGLATDTIEELERFVSDSELYVLATEAMVHKQTAAILKARMLITGTMDLVDPFLEHMEQSVASYRKLAELTSSTYLHGNDLRSQHWQKEGIGEFRDDLAKQRKWAAGAVRKATGLTRFEHTLDGGIRIEAEWMAGDWRIGTEKYAGFEGSGYAAALQDATAPMTARIKLDAGMTCTVSVRALKGGAHQDRALAVEVAGKRLKTTHQGDGPAAGEYTWEDAGTVELNAGTVEIKVHPVGKRHPTADAILLTPAD